MSEFATGMDVPPRHPYAGDLVYTAFSGSHQDAIKKGLAAIGEGYERWEVPYLPIDPAHTGRRYEEVIRVNSQSGKGGVAYLMDVEHGLDLPRASRSSSSEWSSAPRSAPGPRSPPSTSGASSRRRTFPTTAGCSCSSSELSTGSDGTSVVAQLLVDGEHRTIDGKGNGPIDAFIDAINRELGVSLEVQDFQEHALAAGSGASAVAYVEASDPNGRDVVGRGARLVDPRRLASRGALRGEASRVPRSRPRVASRRSAGSRSERPLRSARSVTSRMRHADVVPAVDESLAR